jgi:integrase
VRTVPLAEETVQVLAEHLATWGETAAELEDRTGSRPVRRTARLVFGTSKREPVRRASFNQAWNEAVQRARAAGVDLPARVTPHSLRHTYVALLIAAGKHPKTIQAMVGHKSITETMNTYGHLMDTDAESTRAAIGAAFGRDERPALGVVR